MTRQDSGGGATRQGKHEPADTEEELQKIKAGTIAGQIGALIRDIPDVGQSSGLPQAEVNTKANKKASKKKPVKSVRVIIKETAVTVNIHIIIDFGKSIPEITRRIQNEVKALLQREYADYLLTAVNVWVDGVRFNQDAVRYREEAIKALRVE